MVPEYVAMEIDRQSKKIAGSGRNLAKEKMGIVALMANKGIAFFLRVQSAEIPDIREEILVPVGISLNAKENELFEREAKSWGLEKEFFMAVCVTIGEKKTLEYLQGLEKFEELKSKLGKWPCCQNRL